MDFRIDMSNGQPVGIASLDGRLDAENCGVLQTSCQSWLKETARLVFDCTGLDFLDSSGLGTIVSCLRKSLEQDGDLKLAALSPQVSMVFELTKARKLFSIFPDADNAVRSYASGDKA